MKILGQILGILSKFDRGRGLALSFLAEAKGNQKNDFLTEAEAEGKTSILGPDRDRGRGRGLGRTPYIPKVGNMGNDITWGFLGDMGIFAAEGLKNFSYFRIKKN